MRSVNSNTTRLAAAALAAATVVAVSPAAPSGAAARGAARCANAGLVPSPTNRAAVTRATLCLLNAERRARGVRSLKSNARLRAAAQSYAEHMVEEDFFGHVSPTGSTLLQRLKRSSYLKSVRSFTIGENLGWATGSLATPSRTVRNWMGSPPHRRNILDKRFREIGIGVAIGAPGTSKPGATYTTEFGRRS